MDHFLHQHQSPTHNARTMHETKKLWRSYLFLKFDASRGFCEFFCYCVLYLFISGIFSMLYSIHYVTKDCRYCVFFAPFHEWIVFKLNIIHITLLCGCLLANNHLRVTLSDNNYIRWFLVIVCAFIIQLRSYNYT